MTAPTPEKLAAGVARQLQETLAELTTTRATLAAVTAERDRFLALAQRADSQAEQLTGMASRFKDERDQARQMLADAPHDSFCASSHHFPNLTCDCWKAGL